MGGGYFLDILLPGLSLVGPAPVIGADWARGCPVRTPAAPRLPLTAVRQASEKTGGQGVIGTTRLYHDIKIVAIPVQG